MDKKEDKKTVFRRIGGRIVPIAVGSGAIYGATKINERQVKTATYKLYPDTKRPSIKTMNLKFNILNRLYAKDIERELGKVTDIEGRLFPSKPLKFDPTSYENGFNYTSNKKFSHIPPTDGNKFKMNDWAEKRPHIILSNPKESTLLHELGHAQQFRENSLTSQIRSNYDNGIVNNRTYKATHSLFKKIVGEKEYWKISIPNKKESTTKRRMLKKVFDFAETKARNLDSYMQPTKESIATIASEAGAWKRAVKMAKKGRKLKVLKRGILPFSTYLVTPAIKLTKLSGIVAGAGLIGYGILKKNKDE